MPQRSASSTARRIFIQSQIQTQTQTQTQIQIQSAIRNAQHDALQRRTKSPHARLKAQNCAVASFVA